MPPIKPILLTAALAIACWVLPAGAQTLRIAMTTTDIPTTGGIPDNGSEGGRFAGYPIYDALVNWDFTHTDQPADLAPGLATEWHVDPHDNQRWIFTLRPGVHFHDGSTLTASDIIWNLDRLLNRAAPNYDVAQAGSYANYTAPIDGYEKIDDSHVMLHTRLPFSVLPYLVTRLFIVSPAQYQKLGSWRAFQSSPSGTGPFRVTRVTPHVAIELQRNEDYWDKARVPKLARMVLIPMPDPNTRVAALRSGEVDWIEFPAPDAIASLRAAGFQIILKPYPHVWAWQTNDSENSPLHDPRVRLALNYAIDREGMVAMLNNTATPAVGFYDEATPFFGQPTQHFTHDPARARALLAQAGYGPEHPLSLRVQVPTAGSGNMVPLPMNELIQQNLSDVGVRVEYEVVDWGIVLATMRQSPDAAGLSHRDAIAHGLPLGDPTNFYNEFTSMAFAPHGSNWSLYQNPEVDTLMRKAFETFDPGARNALIAQAHAIVVDDAAWIFIVHDLNARALSPKVKGYNQAQSWYQDFTQLTVAP
jgi:peptide/nickel transport system substrate-binding protein